MSAQLTKKLAQNYLKSRCSMLFPLQHSRSYTATRDPSKVLTPAEESSLESDEKKPSLITVHGPVEVARVSGIPEEQIKERLVRIYLTPKNAMQSGTENANQWEIEFDTKERWENPLMGWSSTGDPTSNIKLQFNDKESAVRFVEKYGYNYFIEGEKKVSPKVKSYGFNFSWNKRTRVSTK